MTSLNNNVRRSTWHQLKETNDLKCDGQKGKQMDEHMDRLIHGQTDKEMIPMQQCSYVGGTKIVR